MFLTQEQFSGIGVLGRKAERSGTAGRSALTSARKLYGLGDVFKTEAEALQKEAEAWNTTFWETVAVLQKTVAEYGSISLTDRVRMFAKMASPVYMLLGAPPLEEKMARLAGAVALGHRVINQSKREWFEAKQGRFAAKNAKSAKDVSDGFDALVKWTNAGVDAQSNMRMDTMALGIQSMSVFYKDIGNRLSNWGKYIIEDLPKQFPDIMKYAAIGGAALAVLFIFTKFK